MVIVITFSRLGINRVYLPIFPTTFAPESSVSRDRFGGPAPACSFSTLRLNRVLTHEIPPDFRGSVHLFIPPSAIGPVLSLSGLGRCVPMVITAESPPA